MTHVEPQLEPDVLSPSLTGRAASLAHYCRYVQWQGDTPVSVHSSIDDSYVSLNASDDAFNHVDRVRLQFNRVELRLTVGGHLYACLDLGYEAQQAPAIVGLVVGLADMWEPDRIHTHLRSIVHTNWVIQESVVYSLRSCYLF